MTQVLQKIQDACDWVSRKGNGSKDSCRVSTEVKWANWEKKTFSPAMCVLWRAETKINSKDEYETFWIPPPEVWISKIALYLGTEESWVEEFVEQCSNGSTNPWKWEVRVSFSESFEGRVHNPRIFWEKKILEDVPIFLESKYCLEKYGKNDEIASLPPYWTKNPPIKLYEGKLISAIRDLFDARKSAGIE